MEQEIDLETFASRRILLIRIASIDRGLEAFNNAEVSWNLRGTYGNKIHEYFLST